MSRRVPIEKKALLGNPGKQPLPEPISTAVEPVTKVPTPPAHLGRDGKRLWAKLWVHAAQWLHPETDHALVSRYCEYMDMRVELKKELATIGFSSLGSQGQTVAAPAFAQLMTLDTAISRAEAALGLSPADRVKLGLAVITMAEKKSRLEDFMDSI